MKKLILRLHGNFAVVNVLSLKGVAITYNQRVKRTKYVRLTCVRGNRLEEPFCSISVAAGNRYRWHRWYILHRIRKTFFFPNYLPGSKLEKKRIPTDPEWPKFWFIQNIGSFGGSLTRSTNGLKYFCPGSIDGYYAALEWPIEVKQESYFLEWHFTRNFFLILKTNTNKKVCDFSQMPTAHLPTAWVT